MKSTSSASFWLISSWLRASSSSTSPASDRRSIPEEKLPSAPVRMIVRISSSAAASFQASSSRANMVIVIALRRWGRLRVTIIV